MYSIALLNSLVCSEEGGLMYSGESVWTLLWCGWLRCVKKGLALMCADTRSLPDSRAGRKWRWLVGGYHLFFLMLDLVDIKWNSRITCFNILLMKLIRSSMSLLSQLSLWRWNILRKGESIFYHSRIWRIFVFLELSLHTVNERPGAA